MLPRPSGAGVGRRTAVATQSGAGGARSGTQPGTHPAGTGYVARRTRLRRGADSTGLTSGYAQGMAALTTRLRLPAWAQDVLLAGFVLLVQLSGTRNAAATNPELATPDTLGYALLVASGAALLVRRRWPVAVFAVAAAISVWYYTAGYPDGPGWLALFVAVYTLTAHGDGHRSVRIVTGGIAALTVVWLATADLEPRAEAGWVFFRIGAAIMAAALGESVRSRRVIAAEAQERAERAERTREEEARRRVDAERLRIAREVHDTVAHAIAIVNVQAGVTAHVLDKRPERAREALVTIEQTSARALRELRATLGMLRDVDDDARSPTPGLGQLDELTGMAREAGLDIKIEAEPAPPELPSAVDRAAYRILQESITNVIRHAGPARVTITIATTGGELAIQVTDDGRGPADAGTGGEPGRGIVGMRERCALLGGVLATGPGPAGGFRVHARLPLSPEAAAVLA
jgi:signal transduction histidine kinase